MSLGSLETEADLTRFIAAQFQPPRAVAGEYVDASTMNLEGRIAEADLAEPNTWLRLATVANRKVAFGTATITGTGTSTATVNVTHGLGTTPVVVIATADLTGGALNVGTLCATVGSFGATTFALRVRDVNAA